MGLNKKTNTTILIKGALKGSQKAYADLMELYWDDIIALLNSKNTPDYNIDDIAVATFTKAFDKLDKFNNDYAFITWISTIANNTLIDCYRKNKESIISLDQVYKDGNGNDFKLDFKAKSLSPEEELISNQEENEVIKQIELLPKNYSEILKLRYILNLSYKEISEKINTPMSNVKVRLMRGRKLLVEKIIDSDNF